VGDLYSHCNSDNNQWEIVTWYDYSSTKTKSRFGTAVVQLSPTAIFSDPAAICKGSNEILEAFPALQSIVPVSIAPPKCINVKLQGETILLTFCLHLQYNLPLYGAISLRCNYNK
jgi:hypothetical protein